MLICVRRRYTLLIRRMSQNNNNNSNSPSGDNSIKALKHRPSRVLGKTSNVSLRSKYGVDQESSRDSSPQSVTDELDKNGPMANVPDGTQPPVEIPELVSNEANGKKDSIWSIWTRRTSQLDQKPLDSENGESSTKSHTTSAASVKSSNSNNIDEVITDTVDTESTRSKDDRKDSWMGWSRKSSSTSLKKTMDEAVLQNHDNLKSVAGEERVLKKDRQQSWSFWNSSTNSSHANDPALSNVLLSGGEAVLFEETDKPKQVSTSTQKPITPNVVVPAFENSLPYYSTSTTVINNFNRLRYTLGFDVPDPKHLYRVSHPPRSIKKVLIIGVHGFFPTKVIRPLIGEPTGTSIKFSTEAEKAVWRWAKRENLSITVQKIALEREGKIFDRVEFFYEVLKKWQKDVESADYIYFAAHSQGCPVSIILLGRLVEDGIITTKDKKISMLLMAGINNGPFYGVDQKLFVRAYSTIENDSLMELFQFQNFDSVHSKEFLNALKIVIKRNIKLTFVGSINDQLVPLYSSTCLHVRHPNIFRATYIDGSSKTPSFVSRSVSMSNHLHNIGLSDHGVVKEISNVLAGPLTGGGHSTIYNDPQVYDLALNFSLYTNDLKYDIPLHFKPYVIEQLGTNPYHLPWCMRGLLHEARTNLPGAEKEIGELLSEFEAWKPETKQLKDMKYRLNGIKSKL